MRPRELRAERHGPDGAPRAEGRCGDLVAAEKQDLGEADALGEEAGGDPGVDADHRGNGEEQRTFPGDAGQGMAQRLPRALEEPCETPAWCSRRAFLARRFHRACVTAKPLILKRTIPRAARLDARSERCDGPAA